MLNPKHRNLNTVIGAALFTIMNIFAVSSSANQDRKVATPPVGIVPILPTADDPTMESYGTAYRWIGRLSGEPKSFYSNPCPLARPTENWDSYRLFSPLRMRNVILKKLGIKPSNYSVEGTPLSGRINFSEAATIDRLDDTLRQIGTPDLENIWNDKPYVYCVYEYLGPFPVPLDAYDQLPTTNNDGINLGDWLFPDPAMAVPLATPQDLLDSLKETLWAQMLDEMDVVETLPNVISRKQVRVAVIDTAINVTDGQPGAGQCGHGADMAKVIKAINCPDNSDGCHVHVSSHLGLDLEPFGDDGVRPNRTLGGFFGTPGTVAQKIWEAAVFWRFFQPGADFVINLSVGWEPDIDGILGNAPFEEAVKRALQFTSCLGALNIAAAGNSSLGPIAFSGPMSPALMEQYEAPQGGKCVAQKRQPLIFSAGGVDALDNPIVNSREDGMPKIAGYASQIPANDMYWTSNSSTTSFSSAALTGTSLAAAQLSATAALVWSYDSGKMPFDVIKTILDGSPEINQTADYGLSYYTGTPVNKISVCGALHEVLNDINSVPLNWNCEDATFGEAQLNTTMIYNAPSIADTYTTMGPQSIYEIDQCGDDMTYHTNADPFTFPCPQNQFYNTVIGPFAMPQPTDPICGVCGFFWGINSLIISQNPSYSTGGFFMNLFGPGEAVEFEQLRLVVNCTDTGATQAEELIFDINTVANDEGLIVVDGIDIPSGYQCESAQIVGVAISANGDTFVVNEPIYVDEITAF